MKPNDGADDPRLVEAAADYLAKLEAGERPDREAYVRRCPDLADALSECLDGVDLAMSLAPTVGPSEFAARIGDFRLMEEIGRGGMGMVYEAFQLSMGRRVALKILPFSVGLDPIHFERFKAECRAAAQLHHSNIVPVHAIGEERGVHFYAMQLIEGRSLASVIEEERGRPIDRSKEFYRRVASMAADIAAALHYSHGLGIIHRDVKPANILVDHDGTPWITDFGLARIASDPRLTESGNVLGTLRYTSPEQAAGRCGVVDHRTDVYSLGATLYEWLALRPAFAATDRERLLHAVLTAEPRRPSKYEPSIPRELETIVLRALSKEPETRYETAHALEADLRRFAAGEPVVARRPSVVERTRRWSRRHPVALLACVCVMVLLTGGSTLFAFLISQEQARTQSALEQERLRADEVAERFDLARRAADDMIALADRDLVDHPSQTRLRRWLLEAGLSYYSKFLQIAGEEVPEEALEATRDRLRRSIADIDAFRRDRQTWLLRLDHVQDALGFADDQKADAKRVLAEIDARRRKVFRELGRLNGTAHRQALRDLARGNSADIEGLLTKEQAGRLQQISLQSEGLSALRNPDVRDALQLSPQQLSRIRSIEAAANMKSMSRRGFGGFGRTSWGSSGRSREERDRSSLARALEVLDDRQRRIWNDLVGEPVDSLTRRWPPVGPSKDRTDRSGRKDQGGKR